MFISSKDPLIMHVLLLYKIDLMHDITRGTKMLYG